MATKGYVSGFALVLHISCLLAVGGCSSPGIRTEKMVPGTVNVTSRHAESIRVMVAGQAAPHFLFAFNEAITQCIRDSHVFEVGEPSGTTALVLEVTVLRLQSPQSLYAWPGLEGPQYPAQGPSAVCTLVARWCLKKSDSGSVICEREIPTSHTHDAPDYISNKALNGWRKLGGSCLFPASWEAGL